MDQLIRHINQVALLIDKKAKVFFKSYKKIKYKLAIKMVVTMIINIKSFIFILKKINNKIKKAFWGPAIIKHVFHLEWLNTYGCHTWKGNKPNLIVNPKNDKKNKIETHKTINEKKSSVNLKNKIADQGFYRRRVFKYNK